MISYLWLGILNNLSLLYEKFYFVHMYFHEIFSTSCRSIVAYFAKFSLIKRMFLVTNDKIMNEILTLKFQSKINVGGWKFTENFLSTFHGWQHIYIYISRQNPKRLFTYVKHISSTKILFDLFKSSNCSKSYTRLKKC